MHKIMYTSAFWLLCFSFGTLYAFSQGLEYRLPAGNVTVANEEVHNYNTAEARLEWDRLVPPAVKHKH